MTDYDNRSLCLLADAAGRILAQNYATKTAAVPDSLSGLDDTHIRALAKVGMVKQAAGVEPSDMEKEAIQLSSLLPRLGGAAKGGITGAMKGVQRLEQAAGSAAGGGGYTPSLASKLQAGAQGGAHRAQAGWRAGGMSPRGAQAAPAAAGGAASPVGGEVGGQIQQEAARQGVSVADYLRGMAVMGVGGAAGYGALQARPPRQPYR